MLIQCMIHGGPDDAPPRVVDFNGEPQPGDYVYIGDGMYQIQARFWRKTEVLVASGLIVVPERDAGQRKTKLCHALFVGLKLVATAEGPLDESREMDS